MKPAPFKEGSLLLGAVAGAALTVGSLASALVNKSGVSDDERQSLCVVEDRPTTLDNGCYINLDYPHTNFCNETGLAEIAKIRAEMAHIQMQIRDVTPLLGRFLNVSVEKSYSTDLKIEHFCINGATFVDNQYCSFEISYVVAQCESLQPILKISDQAESRLPVTLKEKLVVFLTDARGGVLGFILFAIFLWRLNERRNRRKKEKKSDKETFTTMQTGAQRIRIGGFRNRIEVTDDSRLEAAKQFLLALRREDSEKYVRWVRALKALKAQEAKKSAVARLFLNVELFFGVESSWKEIFGGLSHKQIAELVAELEMEGDSESEVEAQAVAESESDSEAKPNKESMTL